MLNKVILMGRISQDLELKSTPNGLAVMTFNVAVEQSFAKQGEERKADFITCVAWRQQAEFISKYFAKGRMIAIEGSLRTRNYEDKNGSKHYVTEVYVDSVSFTGEPKQGGNSNSSYNSSNNSNNYSAPKNNNSNQQSSSISIGDMSDFEEILSDDGVPF